MFNLKDKGLNKVSLFKNNFCKSWAYLPLTGQIVIHKETQGTNWTKYIEACNKSSLEGTGYTLNLYKRGQGIKGAKRLSFTNILYHNGKITAKKFLNARLKAEAAGFKTY
tara:strand:+ start:230 stop:559 length:330 start_codon:yes stop_codon:yes gene_type:complete